MAIAAQDHQRFQHGVHQACTVRPHLSPLWEKIPSDGVLETPVSSRDRFCKVSARLETFLQMSRLGLGTPLSRSRLGLGTSLSRLGLGISLSRSRLGLGPQCLGCWSTRHTVTSSQICDEFTYVMESARHLSRLETFSRQVFQSLGSARDIFTNVSVSARSRDLTVSVSARSRKKCIDSITENTFN
jgi:hypothetical protein